MLEPHGSFILDVREPLFCNIMPMAKGVCCGLLSLKLMLIFIAVIDIIIGGAAICIGVLAFTKIDLPLSLMAYVLMNSFCLLLALCSVYAIARKQIRILRFYYAWKCLEVLLIPIFELAILLGSAPNTSALR